LSLVILGTALLTAFTDKFAMKEFHHPMSITVILHLFGALADFVVLSVSERIFPQNDKDEGILRLTKSKWFSRTRLRYLILSFPIAFMIVVDRLFSFYAAGSIPVSLAHTVKSGAPIFAVIISITFYKKSLSLPSLVSLLPITIGVIISAVTEIDFHMFGFVAATISTLVGVMQAFTTKGLLVNSHATSPRLCQLTSLELHFYVSVTCVALLLPFALLFEGFVVFDLAFDLFGDLKYPFTWITIIFSTLRSLCSIQLLRMISVVSHQVLVCSSRFLIIMTSLIWFNTQVLTFKSFIGAILAVTGFFLYGLFESRGLLKRKLSVEYKDLEIKDSERGDYEDVTSPESNPASAA